MIAHTVSKLNVSVLQEGVQFVEAASDLGPNEVRGFLSVVRWATLRRRFDSLEAIPHLVAAERGHAVPPLLRPSCKELIWISYLASIPDGDAGELIGYRAYFDELELLEAQYAYGGQTAMEELGLLPALERNRAGKKAMRERIRTLGRKLGWPRKAIDRARRPSVSWLATETGREDVYQYIIAPPHALCTSAHTGFSG